jgi:hypothetical protein
MEGRLYSVEPLAEIFGEEIRPVVEILLAILETTHAADGSRQIFQ